MAVLVEPEEAEEVEEEADEEGDEPPLNRLVAPRKPVALAAGALPDPVLCTVGAEASVAPEAEVLDGVDALEAEGAPVLLRPAVLTTVIWRMVVLPPVMVILRPPRRPRSRGTMRELYFSAAVTPVRRRVSSTVPRVTLAVRTGITGGLVEVESPDSRWAKKRPSAAHATAAAATHQKRAGLGREEPVAGIESGRMNQVDTGKDTSDARAASERGL